MFQLGICLKLLKHVICNIQGNSGPDITSVRPCIMNLVRPFYSLWVSFLICKMKEMGYMISKLSFRSKKLQFNGKLQTSLPFSWLSLGSTLTIKMVFRQTVGLTNPHKKRVINLPPQVKDANLDF